MGVNDPASGRSGRGGAVALVIKGLPRWPDSTRGRDFAGSVGGEADTIEREVFMRVRHTIHPRSYFGRSDRRAQRSGSCHSLMESMEGPGKQPPNCRLTPCDRGTGRRHTCWPARGPPKRLMRPEGTVVFARRMVLWSSLP
jgi:hypothetical protein